MWCSFPFPLIVVGVSQYRLDPNKLRSEGNAGDQTVFVATDIKNISLTHFVNTAKTTAEICKTGKRTRLNQATKGLQRSIRIWIVPGKIPQNLV